MNVVRADFGGTEIQFSTDGWFNATTAAAAFGKRVQDWLENKETQQYIAALATFLNVPNQRDLIRASRGRGGGTWLHPKLAVAFGRWIDVKFAVWCDGQIDQLIRGQGDWKRLRHEATATYKAMCDVLRLAREDEGKGTASYHYANEARLVNRVISGEWGGLDRDRLPLETLDLLAKLEAKNLVLLARNVPREDRIKVLEAEAQRVGRKMLPAAA